MKLNILNGDSTLYNFRQAQLPGKVLVWREILSEGPVSAVLSYEDFFALRSGWISETFNSDPVEYETKVISEFNRLKDLSEFDEVVFWFEFDLHCQVNLIFLLDYFYKSGLSDRKLFLISPDSHPNHPDFRGIGELSPKEFAGLSQQKTLLTEKDLSVASQAWKAYCSASPRQIRKFISLDHGQLDQLKPSFLAHLARFPDQETGLNVIEKTLLSVINSGFTERADIYREFWKSTAIFGMGDSQINIYIKRLAELNLVPKNLV